MVFMSTCTVHVMYMSTVIYYAPHRTENASFLT